MLSSPEFFFRAMPPAMQLHNNNSAFVASRLIKCEKTEIIICISMLLRSPHSNPYIAYYHVRTELYGSN